MTNRLTIFVLFGTFAVHAAQAQTAPKDSTPVDPAARQRAAMAAMEESLAKQRASVQQQPLQQKSTGFFVLSPPAPMGATVPGAGPSIDCPALEEDELGYLIGEAAKREELDPDLLRSVMKQESGFHPCAVSSKGAMGLMQLMPATVEQYGVRDPFSNEENVSAGAKMLKELLKRYNGNVSMALGAYNAGPATVDAAKGVPKIQETVDYVNRILSTLGR